MNSVRSQMDKIKKSWVKNYIIPKEACEKCMMCKITGENKWILCKEWHEINLHGSCKTCQIELITCKESHVNISGVKIKTREKHEKRQAKCLKPTCRNCGVIIVWRSCDFSDDFLNWGRAKTWTGTDLNLHRMSMRRCRSELNMNR